MLFAGDLKFGKTLKYYPFFVIEGSDAAGFLFNFFSLFYSAEITSLLNPVIFEIASKSIPLSCMDLANW